MRQLVRQFLQLESASSIILFLAVLMAFVWENSPLAPFYQLFVKVSLFGINEGLMAIFFFLIGLELKRGFLEGELAQLSQVGLPAIAAVGGMVMPALIYLLFNSHHPATAKAWATPVATDIAFALGVLSLFKNVPWGLKLFLLALAIFDDIGAILIIAFFYSHHLSYAWLFQAGTLVVVLYLFNRLEITQGMLYVLVGVGLWLCLLFSGIHPTIAGILLALMIPTQGDKKSLLKRMEKHLHPWVAYFIMPLFALANAGFPLQAISWDLLLDPLVMGIVFGLFIGKQLGIFCFSWALIQTGLARLPLHASWLMLYGISLLCGMGFTMSLFLGTLSFQNEPLYLTKVRFGVILASCVSGMIGAIVLRIAFTKRSKE